MSGQFDQARIYKSALEGGAVATDYRGIPVLIIQPFERERADFHDVRWLAVVDSEVLLFGTITSVRQELDRYLSAASADPSLVHKLARMHSDDETWCVISAPGRNPEIQTTLTALDSRLAELASSADAFQFGIRYRKQVEFEYEATTSSPSHPNSLRQSLTGPKMGSSLLPSQNATQRETTIRGVVKIPVEQFGAWLSKSSGHGARRNATP